MSTRVTTPLAMGRPGQDVRLAAIHGGRQLRARLAELGLVAGVAITIVANPGRAPLILGVKGGRIVLGRGMANQIDIEALEGRDDGIRNTEYRIQNEHISKTDPKSTT